MVRPYNNTEDITDEKNGGVRQHDPRPRGRQGGGVPPDPQPCRRAPPWGHPWAPAAGVRPRSRRGRGWRARRGCGSAPPGSPPGPRPRAPPSLPPPPPWGARSPVGRGPGLDLHEEGALGELGARRGEGCRPHEHLERPHRGAPPPGPCAVAEGNGRGHSKGPGGADPAEEERPMGSSGMITMPPSLLGA